jgi:hypothetical protein
MQVQAVHKRRIQEIMREMKCSKDFECYKSGFTNLSRVKDIGMKTFVECLAENGQACEFSFPFGDRRFCKCPLRIYLAKKLKK